MSAARFDSRVAAGRALHVEELINYALGKALANSSPDERHLTPRENEVSRFVGEGLSTEEIAERLTLSVRTVEGHLTHALAKLGFRSRTQLALWAAKRSAANRGM
jgi:non-specific serine/threonine protein kinase